MRQPETLIKDAIFQYLTVKGIFCWSVNNSAPYSPKIKRFLRPYKYHLNGVADICGVYKGQALFIETKTKTGTQRESQQSFEKRAVKEKAIYILARSVDDVKAVI